MREIQKVGVLGAGVMGSQIAAHLINAGFKVVLLDLKTNFVTEALKKAGSLRPAPFALPEFAELIEVGNFDDDLEKLRSVDWVIEAVKEDLKVKQQLLKRLLPHMTPGTIISSNTSGVSLQDIAEVLPEETRQSFLATHFFNPPRYLNLVEVAPIKETLPEVLSYITEICDRRLGKAVVIAKDTPNYIANRICIMGIMKTFHAMQELELTFEEVDKITGEAIGWPKTATFRTMDLVGLDIFAYVVSYLHDHIPHDEYRDVLVVPDFIQKMIEKGLLGQKTRGGFYKKVRNKDGASEILVINPETLEYEPTHRANLPSIETAKNILDAGERIKFLINGDDKVAEFLKRTLLFTLFYAAHRAEEIANDIVAIDTAVKYGFGWELGPFEILDVIGLEILEKEMQPVPVLVQKMLERGAESFYTEDGANFWDFRSGNYETRKDPEGIISLHGFKKAGREIKENDEASLINIGDGVLCLEFHSTKMNTIGPGIISMLKSAVKEVTKNPAWKGLMIANQGEHFSVGANLDLVYQAILNEELEEALAMVKAFQEANMGLKYMPKPVVAAPFGYTLGGGLEVCLHADAICAAHEIYVGLVEIRVGLIPAGGGTTQMILRSLERIPGNMPTDAFVSPLSLIQKTLETIGMAKTASSAHEAKKIGYFRKSDVIVMNKNRLVEEAKRLVLALARNYRPPQPMKIMLRGENLFATLKVGIDEWEKGGFITKHDALIAGKLAEIMTGGDLTEPTQVSEQHFLEQELKVFLSLCRKEKTQERIAYMLENNKPLRN